MVLRAVKVSFFFSSFFSFMYRTFSFEASLLVSPLISHHYFILYLFCGFKVFILVLQL